MGTCMDTSRNLTYMLGLLHEESGELQGKFDKAVRKGIIVVDHNHYHFTETATGEDKTSLIESIKKELGDVMWASNGIASCLSELSGEETTMASICLMNLEKLASRKERNKIDGEGDNR